MSIGPLLAAERRWLEGRGMRIDCIALRTFRYSQQPAINAGTGKGGPRVYPEPKSLHFPSAGAGLIDG